MSPVSGSAPFRVLQNNEQGSDRQVRLFDTHAGGWPGRVAARRASWRSLGGLGALAKVCYLEHPNHYVELHFSGRSHPARYARMRDTWRADRHRQCPSSAREYTPFQPRVCHMSCSSIVLEVLQQCNLHGAPRRVLTALAAYTEQYGSQVFPSLITLA